MLSPQTTIADLVALARGAALMVSGDTGPTHIAAARRHADRRHLRPDAAGAQRPDGRRDDVTVSRDADLPVPSSAPLHAAIGCACSTSRSTKCSTRSSAGWRRRRGWQRMAELS